MAQGQDHRQPAPRRAAADIGRQRIEPAEQFVEVVGPDVVLAVALDRDAGSAGVAPVIDYHAIAGLRDPLAQWLDGNEPAPPAGLQHDERPSLAEDLVANVDAADLRDGHGRLLL